MGFIYMADVVTFDGLAGIKVGRTGSLRTRIGDHLRDPQWRQFKLLKTWTVRDEVAAETALLAQLRAYARPIHGEETFCHSIDPVRITRMAMGDTVGDCQTSRAWWEVEKMWNSLAQFNRAYSRRRGMGLFNCIVLIVHLAAVAVCAVFAVTVACIGIVEHIVVPVAAFFVNKWKRMVATKKQAALERAIDKYSEVSQA